MTFDESESHETGPLLESYDAERFGPLLGVSDEGSAAEVIVAAGGASAKARAAGRLEPATIGLILDGERMTSAGEVPIGPGEYAAVTQAAAGRAFCTTNVGTRLNARLYQPLPELEVTAVDDGRDSWLDVAFGLYRRFLQTPDGVARPLTIRLLVSGDEGFEALAERVSDLVGALEAGREKGRMASPDAHRLSILVSFDGAIASENQLARIEEWIDQAVTLGVPEVAVDGDQTVAARRRLGVQGLLNVLAPESARRLLRYARSRARGGVNLVHRYRLDAESAARTIWTGLYTANGHGMNGAKYGLVPLVLKDQRYVVAEVQRWSGDITPIPAFYADTPLVTNDDVLLSDRASEALRLWIDTVSEVGAQVVLVDCPDRVVPRIDLPGQEGPRRLVREDSPGGGRGILEINDIRGLVDHAAACGVRVLWSGGINAREAWQLGHLGVFGIFTTSSTSRPVPVGEVLAGDWQLASETEPTELGVRRIHALLQAGFLAARLEARFPELATALQTYSDKLIAADHRQPSSDIPHHLDALDSALVESWKVHWREIDRA